MRRQPGAPFFYFYKERLGTGSPPHPSPSVTASPQGEASGLWSPTRKSVPNQGTQMGTVIAPQPEQCATTAKTSECQRAGHKKRGGGGPPPRLFASGLSLEKAWIPARDRAGTHVAGLDLRWPYRNHLSGAARYCVPYGWTAPKHPWGAAPRGFGRAPTTRRVRSTAPEQEAPGRSFLTNSDTSYSPSAPSCGSRGSKSASAGGGSWG